MEKICKNEFKMFGVLGGNLPLASSAKLKNLEPLFFFGEGLLLLRPTDSVIRYSLGVLLFPKARNAKEETISLFLDCSRS